ncbi:fimbrillin family protein [Parabacteroides chinchillae]|uniref:GLUG domain-containing protein n=1 Tax=Parabacteroides chinchillae TaxID=871327 RepID=A0A8G2F2C8_9BACT|nr:fimbrillin family protein [Parabacteroides chinchillae]SEG18876.1 hypothetical protein SAMN05444001_11911 [Parabacteroides chinchillae]
MEGSGNDDNPASGTVDFVEGNKKSDTNPAKDKLNDKSVTPLEVFISARATAKYEESPSVTLPFKHIVSKLSIRVRNWNNEDITQESISITFYAIPQKWTAEQDRDNALRITKKAEGVTDALTVSFGNLDKQTVSGATYSLIYLPPLTSALGTDFATAGDFCITYSGNKYYGTLKDIDLTNGELQAGEHMRITMDLSENFGVGVGPWIANWSGPDGEETVYGQPHAGIYTLKGLEIFRDAINKGGEIPDSLCTTVDGVRAIRLYNNISVPADFGSIGNAGYPFTGTFDGQGYTISGISGTAGLFGTVGNETTPSDTIRNLRLSGSINGTADGIALLADTVTNAVVTNCHVAGTSSVTSTGSTIGGLVGVAGAGTTISQCSFTGTISGNTIGGIAGSFAGAAISNCFVSETGDATTPVNIAGSGTGSGTIKNSYSVIKTTETTEANAVIGYYWKEVSFSSFDKSTQFDKSGKFSTQISEAETTLLEALNANAGADTGIRWVYVYGKDFPVLEIQ